MKTLLRNAIAAALLLSAVEIKAEELPTDEIGSFPLVLPQISMLGTASVQERSPAPPLTLGGMPASPLQTLVLTPRQNVSEQAAAAKPIEAEPPDRSLGRLAALILVCSVAARPDLGDCTPDNARVVMRVPAEFVMPVTCLMHGQAYLAETAIGQELGADERVKVVCVRRETITAFLRR